MILAISQIHSRCATQSSTHFRTLLLASTTLARALILSLLLARLSNRTLANAPATKCVCRGALLTYARLNARLVWNIVSAVLVANPFAKTGMR